MYTFQKVDIFRIMIKKIFQMHLYAFFGVKKYSGFLMHFSKKDEFLPKSHCILFLPEIATHAKLT